MSDSLFYLFATLAVTAAIFMVSSRSAVNSAMGMIAALVATAADYFLLDAPFLGVLQVLVYAGAVMVLFLFIIMLLDVDKSARAARPAAKWALGATVLLALGLGIAYAITHGGLPADAGAAKISTDASFTPDAVPAAQPLPLDTTAKSFGMGLFTKYMLPLQLAGFLLLSAMIGVVALSKRPKETAE